MADIVDLTAAQITRSLSDGEFTTVEVVESSTMRSYTDMLTANEIDDLVAYLSTRRH